MRQVSPWEIFEILIRQLWYAYVHMSVLYWRLHRPLILRPSPSSNISRHHYECVAVCEASSLERSILSASLADPATQCQRRSVRTGLITHMLNITDCVCTVFQHMNRSSSSTKWCTSSAHFPQLHCKGLLAVFTFHSSSECKSRSDRLYSSVSTLPTMLYTCPSPSRHKQRTRARYQYVTTPRG